MAVSFSDISQVIQMALSWCLYPITHWGFSVGGLDVTFVTFFVGMAVLGFAIHVLNWMSGDDLLKKMFGLFLSSGPRKK